MKNTSRLVKLLEELKKSENLSKKDAELIDEALRLLDRKDRNSIWKALVLVGKILWDFFNDN